MKTPNISKIISSVKNAALKHSPEILTGIGIAGMITTTVMAVRATPKALDLIAEVKEDHKDELDNKQVIGKAIITHVAPVYIPSVITGGFSIACLIGASSVNARRNTALAAAYTLSESTLKEYQDKVIETIGDKKEKEVRDAIAKDKLERNPVSNTEVIVTGVGNTLFYDSINDRYFKSNIEKIKRIENTLNYRLRQEMYINLNEFYYEVGLKSTKLGDDLGWNIDNGEIQFDFSAQLILDEDSIYYGQPCIVLTYDYAPRYGYGDLR